MDITLEQIDKTGLIREAYQIEGIGPAECRTIFVDWAIKLPAEIGYAGALSALLDAYAPEAPDHPMTAVLREGLQTPPAPRRRRGRSRRGAGGDTAAETG